MSGTIHVDGKPALDELAHVGFDVRAYPMSHDHLRCATTYRVNATIERDERMRPLLSVTFAKHTSARMLPLSHFGAQSIVEDLRKNGCYLSSKGTLAATLLLMRFAETFTFLRLRDLVIWVTLCDAGYCVESADIGQEPPPVPLSFPQQFLRADPSVGETNADLCHIR